MTDNKMFSRPMHFQEYLSHHGLIDEVYKALKSPDLSDIVFTVKDVLQKTNNMPPLVKEVKTETKSTAYRNEGNHAYGSKKYQRALICYNKALLYAPEGSRAMKLAYSNRSALLQAVHQYTACLKDIDTCFSLGCPDDVKDKLIKRKENALPRSWMEKMCNGEAKLDYAKQYFQVKDEDSDCVPCNSSNIRIEYDYFNKSASAPKIVALSDIKVGTVVAIENAYVSHLDTANSMFSCYYCHKMDLNLMPCGQCTSALFCSEDCMERCACEYHDTECGIIELVDAISSGFVSRLALKAAIKITHNFGDLDEFIAASNETGMKRLRNSSMDNIFCEISDLSLLCSNDERHFLEGPLYNKSYIAAAYMHYLEKVDVFFPWFVTEEGNVTERKEQFMRAFARVFMFLSLYATNTSIVPSVCVHQQDKTEFHNIPNYGWFAFNGKLKHSCNPNMLQFGLYNKVALVATQPIKRGAELTVSYLPHFLNNCSFEKELRTRNMFVLHGMACNCIICTGEFKNHKDYQLTNAQKKSLRKLNLEDVKDDFMNRNIPDLFAKLCKTLAFLQDVPFSDEYAEVFRLFRKCILLAQDATTSNVMLDYD